MSKRVLVLVTALVMALMMSLDGMVFAKQAQTFGKGQTTTYQGNSTNSLERDGAHLGTFPLFMPLFTGVRGREILRSSDARACIYRP